MTAASANANAGPDESQSVLTAQATLPDWRLRRELPRARKRGSGSPTTTARCRGAIRGRGFQPADRAGVDLSRAGPAQADYPAGPAGAGMPRRGRRPRGPFAEELAKVTRPRRSELIEGLATEKPRSPTVTGSTWSRSSPAHDPARAEVVAGDAQGTGHRRATTCRRSATRWRGRTRSGLAGSPTATSARASTPRRCRSPAVTRWA